MYRNSEGYSDPTTGRAMSNLSREAAREWNAWRKRKTKVIQWPKVYVVSKYAGDVKTNIAKARKYCRFVASQKCIPVASHLIYPQFLNDNDLKERELGLLFGLALLKSCAEVWVFGEDISPGMKQELREAQWRHKSVKYFTEEMERAR